MIFKEKRLDYIGRRKVKDSNQNIAKAVLKIRQDNRLSQEQFAEMVGVTRQAVSRWEMGVSHS